MPKRILVVEDEVDCAQLFRFLLEPEGYAVQVAFTLAEAHQALAQGPPPALVLLDLVLPDGDGLSLCPVIRRRWPSLPVFVVSARGDAATRQAVLAAGCTAFLAKPFDPDAVLAQVRAQIGQP
ncbi:MAG TPA: response regulator [Thermodesulfobacteriota bacterium]